MPRRNRTPGVAREPGRLYELEKELHKVWDDYYRRQREREEQIATRRRFEQLRNRLTR